MKTKIALLLLISCIFVQAQTPEQCSQKIAALETLVSQDDLSGGYDLWLTLEKCDNPGESYFTLGEKLLHNRIEVVSIAERPALTQNLIALYDQYDKRFPSNSGINSVKKAMLMQSTGDAKPEQIFALLDQFYTTHPDKFTDVEAIYKYYDLYYSKFNAEGSEITPEMALAKYDNLVQHIKQLQVSENAGKYIGHKNLLRSIQKLSSELLVCKNLVPYYSTQFEANKSNLTWLEMASERLSDARCFTEPVFLQISQLAYAIKPSSNSAYNLGLIAFRKNDPAEAAKFFTQSADLNTNSAEKAEIYFMVASTIYANSNKARAKEFIEKAIAAEPNSGKTYLLLAQLYSNAGAECGTTEFEKKAINWLAADAAKKAGIADKQFKTTADKLAASYLQKVPSNAEIKKEKKSGRTISYKCWINESLTVPKI